MIYIILSITCFFINMWLSSLTGLLPLIGQFIALFGIIIFGWKGMTSNER